MKSLKVKIKLDYLQQVKLETLSNEHRLLYNFLLAKTKKSSDFKSLNEHYKQFRNENKLTIRSKPAQITCNKLINNIKGFYAKRKKDKAAKFPYKFKSYKYFCSFTLDWNKGSGGFKIKNNMLRLTLCSKIKLFEINLSTYCNVITENNIKTVTFKKEEDNYYLIFTYSEKDSNNKPILNDNFLSIDLGYSNIVTCFSNKIDNFSVKNLRQKYLQERTEQVQSIKDKKKKNSNKWIRINRTLRRLKKKQVNKQKDFQHKLSREIINKCKNNDIDTLIVGDLKTKKVQRKENYKINGLSKSTSSLSRFKTFLEYKAKSENMLFYKPSEYNTSKENCLTSEIEFSSDLDVRQVEVSKGLIINRDLNSAVNIAKRIKGEYLTQDLILEKLELSKMYMRKDFLVYDENLL